MRVQKSLTEVRTGEESVSHKRNVRGIKVLLSVVGKMHDIVVRTLMDVWCNIDGVVYKDSNLC